MLSQYIDLCFLPLSAPTRIGSDSPADADEEKIVPNKFRAVFPIRFAWHPDDVER